ncbi:subtilisin-like serine protease [Serendipita sp. 405]|nr:subtilisin-like serine protease [Serendipita sp. 405]
MLHSIVLSSGLCAHTAIRHVSLCSQSPITTDPISSASVPNPLSSSSPSLPSFPSFPFKNPTTMHRNPLGVSQLARLLVFSIAFHFVSTVAYVIPSSSTASSRRSTVGILDVDGPVREDGYIITFTSSTNATAAQNAIQRDFGFESVTHRYNTDAIKGVSGTFNPTQIERIQAAEFVESIERDAVGGVDALVTQYDAPWGLQRISQVEGLPGGSNEQGLNYQYRYDDSAGNGVDIYIVDSGINIGHMDFGGRARWGKTFGGYTPDIDGLGHGSDIQFSSDKRRLTL